MTQTPTSAPAGADHAPAGDHPSVAATPTTTGWGWLPARGSREVLRVASGDVVVLDTISHEGILGDQGRDPVVFFARHGIGEGDVLEDAVALAASGRRHDLAVDGPHVVTGPVAVDGARPGDVLRVDMLSLARRTDYGIVSSRHGRGTLPGELPTTPGTVSTMCRVRGGVGTIESGAHRITFPLGPFLGLVGVVADTAAPLHSVPPGAHGGNLDLALLTEGSSLYLPVQVPGAMFYAGDPHYAQGDGEVALTAFEAPLRATVRLTVVPASVAGRTLGALAGPYAETPDLMVPIGLDADLDVAVQKATRSAIALLGLRFGVAPDTAYAYLSAAADVCVTQVVDRVKGAHLRIRRGDFAGWDHP